MFANNYLRRRVRNFGAASVVFGGSTFLFGCAVFAEEKVEPPKYPWSHSGLASSYDHARYI